MRSIVTGGMGFIGSNLVRELIQTDDVRVIDNLSTGNIRFLDNLHSRFQSFKVDLGEGSLEELCDLISGYDRIFHLAANADVRGGWSNHKVDVNNNVLATLEICEAARRVGVKEIIFSSTGCVYGDSKQIPTSEFEPFPIQTSLYGASKVAAEGVLSAYAAQGAFNVTVLRFVSVLGENYHHGHVIDFVEKLQQNPHELEILGNGTQRKSYIHVDDCVNALISLRNKDSSFEVFNIGNTEYISVKRSAELVSLSMGLSPKYIFGEEIRGWIGDNPFTFLDIRKSLDFGWQPTISIENAVDQTVKFLVENDWVIRGKSRRLN